VDDSAALYFCAIFSNKPASNNPEGKKMNSCPCEDIGSDGTDKHTEPSGKFFNFPESWIERCKAHREVQATHGEDIDYSDLDPFEPCANHVALYNIAWWVGWVEVKNVQK
jgi:hypothetical protein